MVRYNYTRGQRLLLHLYTEEQFEGDCDLCGEHHIEIANITNHQTGDTYPFNRLMTFYRQEIRTVTVLNPVEEPVLPAFKSFEMTEEEYKRLKTMTWEATYISEKDEIYYNSCKYLKKSENVAVFAIGSMVKEENKITVMAISTFKACYVFDILLLNDEVFPAELREILESSTIRKVVHDAVPLNRCLREGYNVVMLNIFDTCAMDIMIQKMSGSEQIKARTLAECLHHYLGFTTGCLNGPLEITLKEWIFRPFGDFTLKISKFVAFLITLKRKQLEQLTKVHDETTAVNTKLLVDIENLYYANRFMNRGSVVPPEVKELVV